MVKAEVNGEGIDLKLFLEKGTPQSLSKILLKQEVVDITMQCNSRETLRLGKTGEYGWELLDDAPGWESIEECKAEGIMKEMFIRYQKECM